MKTDRTIIKIKLNGIKRTMEFHEDSTWDELLNGVISMITTADGYTLNRKKLVEWAYYTGALNEPFYEESSNE